MLLVSSLNAWSLNTALSYGSGTRQEAKRQNAVTEIKVNPQMGKQKKKATGPQVLSMGRGKESKRSTQNKTNCLYLELREFSIPSFKTDGEGGPVTKGLSSQDVSEPRGEPSPAFPSLQECQRLLFCPCSVEHQTFATAGVNPGGEAAQSHGSRGLGTGGSSIHPALPQALSSAEQARLSGDQASAKLMLRRNHA